LGRRDFASSRTRQNPHLMARSAEDNCPNLANADQADLDNDGQGNVCDGDRDGDGVANDSDYAPDDPNVQTPLHLRGRPTRRTVGKVAIKTSVSRTRDSA
jgi:Thrombospondin type 3 repeat